MASRGCAACGEAKPQYDFSARQWRKGVGRARCADCVAGVNSGDGAPPVERVNKKSGALFTRYDVENPFEEGGFRWVAQGVYVSGPRAGEPCVAKWLKSGYVMSADGYKEDIKCARKAVQIVREFNAERIIDVHIRVNIPEVWEFDEETGLAGVMYMQEPYIEDYDKWNSNSGWYDDSTDWGEAMQALSHFSYHRTGGQFVLCDIQGGLGANGAILSDPAILSRTMTYGDTDWGPHGISHFFALHQCNQYCNPNWMTPAESHYYGYAVENTTMFGTTTGPQPTEQTVTTEEEYNVEPTYYQDENGYYYYYYPDADDDDTEDDGDEDGDDDDEYYLEEVEYEYEDEDTD